MPYALQRLLHGSPVLCPARALLTHIPLGPRPWLHQLRSRLPGLVRRLHSYYGGGPPLPIGQHPPRPPPSPPPTPSQTTVGLPPMGTPASRAQSAPACPLLSPRRVPC